MILNGRLSINPSSAIVSYTLKNLEQESAFIASIPTDVQRKVYPESAYCSLSPDGGYVNLILGNSPLPMDRDVEYGVAAYFVRVLGGQTYEAVLELPVPLQEWNGYFPPRPRPNVGALVDVRRMLLHVTVIPESRVRWIRPAPGLSEHWSVGGENTSYVLPLELDKPLKVWKREDNFPRPMFESRSSQ